MMQAISKAWKVREELHAKVSKRRAKWAIVSKTIEQCLDEFKQEWQNKTGDSVYIDRRTNTKSVSGILTINCNCVGLFLGNYPTGIGERTDHAGKVIIEKSGRLEFAQMPDGYILIVATPPESELRTLSFSQIVINRSIDPGKLNYREIERAVACYLWLQQTFGYAGRPTFVDRWRLLRFWVGDWRHSNDWRAWAAFWGIVLALLLAGVSALADLKTLLSSPPTRTETHSFHAP